MNKDSEATGQIEHLGAGSGNYMTDPAFRQKDGLWQSQVISNLSHPCVMHDTDYLGFNLKPSSFRTKI